jgi:hypothetical protein
MKGRELNVPDGSTRTPVRSDPVEDPGAPRSEDSNGRQRLEEPVDDTRSDDHAVSLLSAAAVVFPSAEGLPPAKVLGEHDRSFLEKLSTNRK